MNNDQNDIYGFYKSDGVKFYSKYEAMCLGTPSKTTWHYNDQLFSSFDWKKPSMMPLSELYRRRAEQLRNDYDYLILMYSGGADSENILDTFVTNNIHLDEVCHYVISTISQESALQANSWPPLVLSSFSNSERSCQFILVGILFLRSRYSFLEHSW